MDVLLEALLLMVLLAAVAFIIEIAKTSELERLSVGELEQRLREQINIGLSATPRDSRSKKWKKADEESERIVKVLKARTGREYKTVSLVCAELLVEGLMSGTVQLDTGGSSAGDKSVVKRGVVGGILAGPAGAVVGALSAMDHNNRKK